MPCRHGVAVVEVAGVEVAGRHDPLGAIGQADGQRASLRVERGDRASESVEQAVRTLVPQAHDAVAGAELTVAGDERLGAKLPAIEHLSPDKTVEVGDVVASEGEDHDVSSKAELGRPV